MIGVSVAQDEREVAEEFFQLFKTPWEFAREDAEYDVLLCTLASSAPTCRARLCVQYAANAATAVRSSGFVHYREFPLFLSGPIATFPSSELRFALLDGREPIAQWRREGQKKIVEVGYNIFGEVRHLLTHGQSIENAPVPALDLHIDLLRHFILGAGLPLIEIPPAPEGHRYIVCLSHDIDHPVFRNHRFDNTMVGFLYRATIGTVGDVFRRRRPVKDLARNLWATVRLPFVHLGLASDPWLRFDEYLEIERGLGATYFAIPVPNDAGRNPYSPAPAVRASSYRLTQIKLPLARITQAGAELGLHGLNAWLDETDARAELDLVAPYSNQSEYGVRMHWLYFDEGSPRRLEQAGLQYDSSVGYNETVGYRAGTGQAYRPFGASTLLELPLHIMDTALFFAGFLNLCHEDAMQRIERILQHAGTHGGAVTINWHDRSLFAERHWGEFYIKLVSRLKAETPWFPTIANAVKWFRQRREARFVPHADKSTVGVVSPESFEQLPRLLLRTHRPHANAWNSNVFASDNIEVVDQPVNPSMELNVVV